QASPTAHVYDDYRASLDREQLDVVAGVLPSHLDHEVAAAARGAGRDLSMERSSAPTPPDGERPPSRAAAKSRPPASGPNRTPWPPRRSRRTSTIRRSR